MKQITILLIVVGALHIPFNIRGQDSYSNAEEMVNADSVVFESYSQTVPGTEVSFELAPIPEGTYMLGSPETEEYRDEDEGPQRQVMIEAFWMGVTEVPYELYELFMDKDADSDTSATNEEYDVDAITRPSPPYEDPTFGMGKEGYPAGSMTQYAALQFCKWLTEKTGVFYRLPTEAEWEYACRAGSDHPYHFGEDIDSLTNYAWFYDNSDGVYHKVGTKKPNSWGLYDMHGNVAEWTLDEYQAEFYATLGDTINVLPWSKPTKLHPRTVRGGTYDDDPEDLRSAERIESDLDWKRRDPQLPKSFWWNTDSPFVGFRLVRPAKPMTKEDIARFWSITLDE